MISCLEVLFCDSPMFLAVWAVFISYGAWHCLRKSCNGSVLMCWKAVNQIDYIPMAQQGKGWTKKLCHNSWVYLLSPWNCAPTLVLEILYAFLFCTLCGVKVTEDSFIQASLGKGSMRCHCKCRSKMWKASHITFLLFLHCIYTLYGVKWAWLLFSGRLGEVAKELNAKIRVSMSKWAFNNMALASQLIPQFHVSSKSCQTG